MNENPPVKRYVKTVPSKLGGVRFDTDGKNHVGFILETQNVDTFVYDDEVLEIYTAREDRALRQLNKSLFTNGYLKEYMQEAPDVDVHNMLTDDEILEIAKITNIQVLQKRIAELTSSLTVRRILTAANDVGRPIKTIAAIQARLDAIG